MESAWALVTIGGVTLMFNVGMHFLGGGWKLSGRLTAIETSMNGVREGLKELSTVLVNMADLRGDIKVIETRYTALDQRVTAQDREISELRHGRGFVRGPGGIDGEYP